MNGVSRGGVKVGGTEWMVWSGRARSRGEGGGGGAI